MFSKRVEKAIRLSSIAHKDQLRKDGITPYVSHCFAVGYILKEDGFPEDVIIAGILHDTLEDTDLNPDTIKNEFNEAVYKLVLTLTDEKGLSTTERKKAQVEKYTNASNEIKAIKAADLLHNISGILEELNAGQDIWDKFDLSKTEQIMWYEKLVGALENDWNHPIVDEVKRIILELKNNKCPGQLNK